MDDTRFLLVLNAALQACGLDPSVAASPRDPAAVAAWARFLSACAEQGVSIADPRWARVELRRGDGGSRLVLPTGARGAPPVDGQQDFRVGLSLLMSLFGSDSPSE
jgi:hypothetical protein